MSSDEEDDDDVTAQAFAGLKNHVDGYKSYMSKLKKGARSGISQSFGNAADLLPAEHLQQYTVGRDEVNRSLLKNGADPQVLRQAIEKMVLLANTDSDEDELETYIDGKEVIGVVFENGKKLFMLDDFSKVEAPEPIGGQQSTVVQKTNSASLVGAVTSPLLPEPQNSQATPAIAAYPSSTVRTVAMPNPMASGSSPVASSATNPQQSLPAPPVEPSGHADLSSPALRVTTKTGAWLWDISFIEESVVLIQMADGTVVQPADENKYVISWALKPGQKFPQVEIVEGVTVDTSTGNIYYQNQAGNQAIAFLNNGWRIDQVKKSDGVDQYFVTEPQKSGQSTAIRQEVLNLVVDADSGDITYETMDGGAEMTLKNRRLT